MTVLGYRRPIVFFLTVPVKLRNYFKYFSYTILTTGNNNKTNAMTEITLANGRVKKIENEPPEIKSDCLRAGSAKGPRTIAKTAGAIG